MTQHGPWTPGRALGRYELLVPIAKGGQAQVWAARLRGTRGFQKLVAIKTIRTDALEEPNIEQMLLEEASVAAAIRHPNVAETLELGEEDGVLYLVMEWIDGEPLNVLAELAIAHGGMPLKMAVNLVAQVCRGLHAAHELRDEDGRPLGLVHRDVSPQNILVSSSGAVKLVDFGIAKATLREVAVTDRGQLKGKFSYMAPEQVAGERVDRRTDLFALGIILYALTTGRHPFKSKTTAETVRRILNVGATPPSQVIGEYPAALEAVVLRAVEKRPDKRYATARELLVALERAMPDAFDAAFEPEFAHHMQSLLAKRDAERRRIIRSAQETLDHTRLQNGQVGSPSAGSLRAVSVDPSPSGSSQISQSGGAQKPSYSTTAVAPAAKALPEFRSNYRGLGGVVALAALLVAGAVAVPFWNLWRELTPGPPSIAAAPAPVTEPSAPDAPAQTPTAAESDAEAEPHSAPDAGAPDAGRSVVPSRAKTGKRVSPKPAPAAKEPAAGQKPEAEPAPVHSLYGI